MGIDLTFRFDNPSQAADFLAKMNGDDWPSGTVGAQSSHTARKTAESTSSGFETPYEDAQPDSASEPDTSDPWASQAKPAKAAAKPAADTSKLFPASGEYVKDSPNGDRTWTFGLAHAPDCDCGYTAAKFSGVSNGKPWAFYKCPVGFGNNWKDKCDFSENAKGK